MNTTLAQRGSTRAGWRRVAAFTVSEILTAMGVFSLVIVGMVYTHIFSLRVFNITATKLSASQNARQVLNRVVDEIRSGKLLVVGNGSEQGFTNIPDNAPQAGNALQIYPSADTNTFVRYFLDGPTEKLKRLAPSGHCEVLASYITNQIVFRAEDFLGNTLTNDQNNRTIKLTLEFYQWEFPVAQITPGGYYDYCRLQTRITRRAID